MSLLHCAVVHFDCFTRHRRHSQHMSCFSDLLKEEMTAMMRKEHRGPRSSVNPKNARSLKRSFEFSVLES